MRKILALILALVLAGCAGATRSQRTATSPPPSATTTTVPAATSLPPRARTTTLPPGSPAPPMTAAPTTTQPGGSAYDQLVTFAQAAENMDQKLRHAAELINSVGPPWTSPLPAGVVSSVEAAKPEAVATTIPYGLPHDLQRQAILVYSDLVSRRDAMRWFGTAGFPYDEPNPEMQQELLAALANGAPAAARFSTDLSELMSAAKASKPFSLALATSRDAAELLLLIEWTDGVNGGCASTGGMVITTLPTIIWTDNANGTISGVAFNANLVNGSWQVTIQAC